MCCLIDIFQSTRESYRIGSTYVLQAHSELTLEAEQQASQKECEVIQDKVQG
jgi:hypothetical protein